MQCPESRENWSDLFDGSLDAGARRRVETHFSMCPDCRTGFERFRTALDALRSAPAIPASAGFEGRVMAAVEPAPVESGGSVYDEIVAAMPPPAAPKRVTSWRWAAAMAAVMLVAILTLVFVEMDTRARMNDAERLVTDLRRQLDDARSTSPGPSIEDYLDRLGLVSDGAGGYVPREWLDRERDGFVRVDGRWVPARDAYRDLAAQFGGAAPSADAEGLARGWMVDHGYVEVDGLWVPSDMVRSWEEGLLAAGPRDYWAPEALEAAFLRQFDLVRDEEGRLWPRDELQVHLAEHTVRPDLTSAREAVIYTALRDLEIAPPVRWNDLMVYPIRMNDRPEIVLAPFHNAMLTGRVSIEERGPFAVRVTNRSDGDVWLAAGEVLVGGAFDRVAAREAIVPRGESVEVPVYDASPSVLRTGTPRFEPFSGHSLAPPSVLASLLERSGQAEVWARLAGVLAGAPSLYEMYQTDPPVFAQRDLFDVPSYEPRMVGVVIAIRGRVVWGELFASHSTLLDNFDRIVAAAAAEAAAQGTWPSGVPDTIDGVKRFLENLARAEMRDGVLVSGERVVGSVLVHQGQVAHLTLLEPARAVDDAEMVRVAQGIDASKITHFTAALGADARSTDAALRIRAARELGRLGGHMQAQVLLVPLLRDENVAVRRLAVEGLRRPMPPGAVDALVDLLGRSSGELQAAVADALGRSGDANALRSLQAVAESGPPEEAGHAGMAIVTGGQSAPTADEARGWIEETILLYEVWEARQARAANATERGAAEAEVGRYREGLRRITRQDFRSAAAARRWWDANGEAFLRSWPPTP